MEGGWVEYPSRPSPGEEKEEKWLEPWNLSRRNEGGGTEGKWSTSITEIQGDAVCMGGRQTWPPKAREMSSAPVGMKMTLDFPDAAIFCSVSRIRICEPHSP